MSCDARAAAQAGRDTDDPDLRPILERLASSLRKHQAEAASGKSLADMAGEGEEWAALVLKAQRQSEERVVAEAATLPLHFSSGMPIPAAAAPDVILVHPEATPEQLARAMWTFVWTTRGIRGDGIEMEAALRPIAFEALEKHRKDHERQPSTP